MKNLIILSFIILSLTACNSKSSKPESTAPIESQKTETTEKVADSTAENKSVVQLYSCPMHPEVKGEKGSECPKCGMALTEPVK
ncbi:heavy metal-binding domain-containing protein [Flavobacterium terrisoli]|uniref:heavy metal-binding domain-containing protein n=1 Tax=Flavobacterium terrisoli TaxID=3242195 RepID=UPI0025436238|nr:heavy metal-binding domain-containing protein [Flavobacterium buctense]